MNKFLKMMSQNDSRALQARASQINTTGEIAQKSIIQELKNKKAKLEIAIQDLTKMSDLIRSRTYEAFFPLIATAVIYFLIAHLLASGLSLLEFRLDPRKRRAAKGGRP